MAMVNTKMTDTGGSSKKKKTPSAASDILNNGMPTMAQQLSVANSDTVVKPGATKKNSSGNTNTANTGSNNTGSTGTTPKAATTAATTATTTAAPAATSAATTTTTPVVNPQGAAAYQSISETTKQGLQQAYVPSQAVQDAYARLQEVASGKPGAYQSKWQDTINQLYGQIQGRDPFSYDPATDPLYLQYRALYTQQGRNAMMDTMGQAAGLTGGYGSTYSQNAGQQAYDQYLQQLNEVVPELASQAYDRYKDEGDELYRQYQMAQANEDTDYGRYRDTVSDWQAERSDARTAYDSAYNKDYGEYSDTMNRNYNLAQMESSDYWNALQMEYQKERDKVADEQWQKQYDLSRASRGSSYRSSGDGDGDGNGDNTDMLLGDGLGAREMSVIKTQVKKVYKEKGADAAVKALLSYEKAMTGKVSGDQFETLLALARGEQKN